MKNFSAKYLLLAASFLLLASLIFLGARVWCPKKEPINNLAELIKAIGANRVTEGRLSGGFAYAPYVPLPKGEKKEVQDLAEIRGNMLISPSETSLKDEALNSIEPSQPIAQSKSRGVQQINYLDNLLLNSNTNLSRGFPNIVENVLSRGDNGQEKKYSSSNVALKVADLNTFKRATAAAMFADSNENESTAETSHVVGIANMFLGDFEEAISYLEKASIKAPNDAKILNDLAVAYLERFNKEDNPQDLVFALAKVYDAFNINKSLPEIQFNYALLLKMLFLKDLSKSTWQRYLQLETAKEWRALALEYIKELNAPTVADLWEREKLNLAKALESEGENSHTAYKIIEQYPNPSRLYVIEGLLAEWGESYLKGESAATHKLSLARLVGNILAELQDDNMIKDMVTVIDRFSKAGKKEELKKLAYAHQVCKEGINLIDQSLPVKAYEKLKLALPIFGSLNDLSSQMLTMLHLARCERALLKYEVSLKTIYSVLQIAEKQQYFYLLGRSWAQIANLYLLQVNVSKSVSACKKSEIYLKKIGDWDNLTLIYLGLQSNSLRLNDLQGGLKYSYTALISSNLEIKKRSLLFLLSFLSENVFQIKQENIALLFYDELIKMLLNKGANTEIASGFQWRSLVNQKLGNKTNAMSDLEKAKKYAQLSEDASFRLQMEQVINVELAEVNLLKKPLKSIELLDKTEIFFTNVKDYFYKTQIYLIKAKAYLQLEDFFKAEEYLQKTINQYEKERGTILTENNKITFFENMLTAYDEMIKLQVTHRRDYKKAFDYSERVNSRTLLDAIEKTKQSSLVKSNKEFLISQNANSASLDYIQQKISSSAVILKYKIFSEKLFIWVIKKDAFYFEEVSVNEKEVTYLTDTFVEQIQKGFSKEKLQNSQLYEILISPIEKYLSGDKVIIVVPDGNLSKLPFSALVDPNSKRYLVENFAIGYSPSVTIFIYCFEKGLSLANQEKKLLVIGNPKFTKNNFPKLSYLEGAEEEAQSIGRLYVDSKLLIKEQATKKVFIENLTKYNVIHFAGHGLINQSNLTSLLVLASETSSKDYYDEALFAYELYRYKFLSTELVVLSACQTANGQNLKGEGVMNLARPFLAGGVPCVIANLWDANDVFSKELLVRFHKNFLNNENCLEALQQAQKSFINSQESQKNLPKIWATLVLFGSGIKN
jgi:CHAT domain-containing protein